MSEKQTTNQIQGKKKVEFTDVQVRIHNTQHNFKTAIEIAKEDLFAYIDKIRKEAKDFQGNLSWQKYAHLPLVAFVDADAKEEVVFATQEDLPTNPAEIRTKSGTLIAKIT